MENLKRQIKMIENEQLDELKCNRNFNKIEKLERDIKDIAMEIANKMGLIYNNEEWITSIMSDECETEEMARQNLLNKVKDLNGVDIGYDGHGVKFIKVYSKYKTYVYSINAHHYMKVIGQEEAEGFFGKYMRDIMVPVIQARFHLTNNGYHNYKEDSYFEKVVKYIGE